MVVVVIGQKRPEEGVWGGVLWGSDQLYKRVEKGGFERKNKKKRKKKVKFLALLYGNYKEVVVEVELVM